MYFELRDGKAVFATDKITDNEVEIYAFSVAEKDAWIAQYPNATVTEIPQPTQDILTKSDKIKGKTFSKSDFERLLVEPDPDQELSSAISAATTLDELKNALLGNIRAGKVKGAKV